MHFLVIHLFYSSGAHPMHATQFYSLMVMQLTWGRWAVFTWVWAQELTAISSGNFFYNYHPSPIKHSILLISYDYAGYGMSTGKPSEKNLYADIDAAWHALRTRYGISPENVILYGQSIGTVPTVDLASRYQTFFAFLSSKDEIF